VVTLNLEGALRLFAMANTYIESSGQNPEIFWQRRADFDSFTETDFLRETAWVILCSGFRERVVRHVFDYISLCFCDWESASAIIEADPACRLAAMASFHNSNKLNAIVASARYVHQKGFSKFQEEVAADPFTELRKLPYIGPITVWHLAKNLGLDVAKPDRHLARVSSAFGFSDTDHFCTEIAKASGEQKNVVDLIVWRFLADNPEAFGMLCEKNLINPAEAQLHAL
jgi:hypothetical protein